MTTPRSPGSPAVPSVFFVRDYRLFVGGRMCGSFSYKMMQVAIGWQIYDLTGQALALGLVGLSLFLPQFLLLLPAGDLADRYERRRMLALSYLGITAGMAALFALTLSGVRDTHLYYAALALIGCGQAFTRPAAQSFIPFLVSREQLPSAIAWQASSGQTTSIVAPMAGGFLYALAGPEAVYSVGLALYIATTFSLYQIRTDTVRRREGQRSNGWLRLREGVAYVLNKPIVGGAISLDLFAVMLGGATSLMPIFAKDILDVGPDGLGWLRAAPAFGGVFTAIILSQMPLGRDAGRLMFAAVAVFGVATIVFGLSTSFTLSMAALVVLGVGDMISANIRSTMIQLATPDEMRGRVSSVNALFIGASNELGDFESGMVAAWVGAVPAVIIGGAGTLAVVAIWMYAFPALRRVDRLADLRPAEAQA